MQTTPPGSTASVVGILAHGLWFATEGPLLYDPDALVPTHPWLDAQYAKLVVSGDMKGDIKPGDFVIFSRHEGGRLPKGRVNVRRRKGLLSESALWKSDGRILTSDSASLTTQETVEYDPDDDSFVVEGVAVALFRRL